jgi:hypothetical protein
VKREVVKPPWRPPTRRAFVAMLGLGVALVAKKRRPKRIPRSTWTGTTRWIGHC